VRGFVRASGGNEVAGVQAYIDSLNDDLADLRQQLARAGFDLAERPIEFQAPAAQRPAPQVTKPEAPKFGAGNKLFTEDAAMKARARLLERQKNRMAAMLDPEDVIDGLTMAGYYVEGGARSFGAYAKKMIDALGDWSKPYLRQWYEALRYQPGVNTEWFTPAAAIDSKSLEAHIAEVEDSDAADSQPSGAQGTDQNGDAGQSPGDVPGADGKRPAGPGAKSKGRGGKRGLRSGLEPGAGQVDAEPGGQPAGSPGERGNGNAPGLGGRARSSRRVPRGKPVRADGARNYIAPAGSLEREGSWRDTAARNLDIIELLKKLEAEGRQATPEEQALMAKFTGWGAGEIRNNLFSKNVVQVDRATGKRTLNPDYATDAWRPLVERAAKLFSEEELETALQTTQYAHYTGEPVIRGIWSAMERLGFKGGRIFEPGMGIGLFPVAGPANVMEASRYTGVELDKFTARIAKFLLPQEAVIAGDFVRQKFPDGFFDVAMGNPPFSSTIITDDPQYKRLRLMLHDFFFAKTIDKVRPGGLLVFVTSKGTMDKLNDRAREYLAERADLLGAIRLPQTAFKGNAGTEVVTDVIFLRKRVAGEEASGPAWKGVENVKLEDGQETPINEYFAAHPEMVLGQHALTGSMYRQNEYTVLPREGDIAEQFAEAVKNLPANVFTPADEVNDAPAVKGAVERDFNPKAKKEGSLYLSDKGTLMVLENGSGVALDSKENLSSAEKAWLKDYVGLRDAIKQAQYDQLNDGDWETSLKALNKAHDAFVKKHGHIMEFSTFERTSKDDDGQDVVTTYRRYKHKGKWEQDIEGALVSALEKVTEDGKIVKGAFMQGRTLKKPTRPKIETTQDAMMVSLDERGRLDLNHIAELSGRSLEETIGDLGDAIFRTPAGEWQTADEYLSGDVVSKLEEAETAAKTDEDLERNVKALQAVQPKPLSAANITVALGAGWIKPEYVEQFADEVLGAPTKITYEPVVASWTVDGSGRTLYSRTHSEWGTKDRSPLELLSAILNAQPIKITHTTKEGTWHDTAGTAQANEMADKINKAFMAWAWRDSARAKWLLETYNRRYNNLAPRRFDGSHLSLPGLNLKYKLYPHQLRAIWRIIQTGNTYLDHAVGAGKTLEMIVSIMEQRRLGLVQKPMLIVPNHMLEQFAAEFLDAYPAANIMVAGDKNFHTHNRRRFVAQAALNNPDVIIMTHSSFGLLRTTEESRAAIVDRMIAELQAMADEAGDRTSRSKIETQIEAIKRRFAGKASTDEKDNVVNFEDMGVDMLYVDEAHEFRKLDFATNRTNIKGIDPKGSAKALDLYIKTRYLAKVNPGRSLVMASGTPVTNTMGELHTVMRFMDEELLEEDNIRAFDSWAGMFGRQEDALESDAAGRYTMVSRFRKFVNVPELMKRVRNFMDVLTTSQLGELVQRPDIETGQPIMRITPATDALKEYMENVLAPRIEVSKAWKPSKDEPGNPDPIVAIITDGKLAAIDLRFVNPKAPNDPDSKLNQMIDQIIEDYHAGANDTYGDDAKPGSTQIVFSYIGFGDMVAASRGFDPKAWIYKRLKEAGIPNSELAWMGDYDTHAKKAGLFKEMKNGTKRILFGSPKNMGTGLNVQRRLKVLHYLSPPWYPADIEQPHGRILRQGNLNKSIRLNWYATKGTYDSTAWGLVAGKARSIEQAFVGDDSVRTIDDISDSNQYSMVSALAAGDERAIRLATLQTEIEKLTRLQAAHAGDQRQFGYDVRAREQEEKKLDTAIAKYTEASKLLGYEPFSVKVDGATLNKPGEVGTAVIDKAKAAVAKWTPADEESTAEGVIAQYQGKFPLSLELGARNIGTKKEPELRKTLDLKIKVGPVTESIGGGWADDWVSGTDGTGLGVRIRNVVDGISQNVYRLKREAETNREELAKVRSRLGAPFEHEQELVEAIAEAARLTAEMASTATEVPWGVLELETWEGEGGATIYDPFLNEEQASPELASRGIETTPPPGLAPGAFYQPDMFGGPSIAEQEMVLRDKIDAELKSLAEEYDGDEYDMMGDVDNRLEKAYRDKNQEKFELYARLRERLGGDSVAITRQDYDYPADAGIDETGPMGLAPSFMGNDVEREMGIKADTGALVNILGEKLYDSSLPDVTVKEMLQNSFDGVKSAIGLGMIKAGEGRIDITADADARTITVEDNGSGMTPDIVEQALLTIAGTNKEGLAEADRSGGLGLAKLAFVFANKRIRLWTVRDGRLTTLDSSGPELLAGGVKVRTTDTDQPNGTKIEVTLPDTYRRHGVSEPLTFPFNRWRKPEALSKPLIGDVAVKYHRKGGTDFMKTPLPPESETLPIGRNFDLKRTPKVTTAHFHWGDVDVYMGPRQKDGTWPDQQVLSSGLYQFGWGVNTQPIGGTRIPYELIFDVRPSVAAHHFDYPINNQREGFNKAATGDMAVLANLLRYYSASQDASVAGKEYAAVQTMPRLGAMDLETVRQGKGGSVEFADAGLEKYLPGANASLEIPPEVTVKGGRLEGVDLGKMVDRKNFEIPAGNVPTAPLFHSNLNVDLIDKAAAASNVPKESLRYVIARLGTIVQDFAKGLGNVPQYQAFAGADRVTGISLDKSGQAGYQGVNILVPFKGFFFNPFGVFTRDLKRSDAIASQLFHTLMHEATHELERKHEESYTSELARLYGTYNEHNEPFAAENLTLQIYEVINEHRDAWNALKSAFDDPATKNVEDNSTGVQSAAFSAATGGNPPSAPGANQNQGTVGVGGVQPPSGPPQSGSNPSPNPGPRVPVTFDNALTEARWKEARKGVAGAESFIDRITDGLAAFWQSATRHYRHLPNNTVFADVREQLRKLEAAPTAAKEKIVEVLRNLTKGMTSEDLDLFTRKVILDDLAWEVTQDHDLPFALTPADVSRELAKVNAALTPELQAKVRERKLIVRAVSDRLVAAGVLSKHQVKNPSYYRHVVLDYARAQHTLANSAGAGRLRTPKWARRMGSKMDINANLLEAEFDWLHKALTDIATATSIDWIKKSDHNIRDGVIQAAKDSNQRLFDKALKDDLRNNGFMKGKRVTSPMNEQRIYWDSRIAMGLDQVKDALQNGRIPYPAEFDDIVKNLVSDVPDPNTFRFLTWILDNDMEGAMGAALAFKGIAGKKKFVQSVLGDAYADVMDLPSITKRFAPPGHVAWQPDEGKLLFTVKTLPERVIDGLMDKIMADQEATMLKSDAMAALAAVRPMMAMGADKYYMVLPEELANTLNELRPQPSQALVRALLEAPQMAWKAWTLINPLRIFKYNLNNFSGDLDGMIAGNPKALREVPRAFKEIFAVMYRGKDPSARYSEAIERGVFESGLTIQEMPDINDLSEFARLVDRPNILQRIKSLPGGFWRASKKITQFRENLLRYAAYLNYADRLEAGEPMDSIGYGAGNRKIVNAITDPKDKAALLARDLLGDYGNVTHLGNMLRKRVLPFWSWQEINAKRYWRLTANAFGEGVGKGLATAGGLAATRATALGAGVTVYLGLRMALIYGLIALWNALGPYSDDDDELSDLERNRLHITLGKDADGNIRLVRFQGALSDALGLMGFQDAIAVMREVEAGRAGYGELIAAIAKAPVNRVVSNITPMITTPFELASGVTLWPDVFKPRSIRDGWREAFSTFSLDIPYDLVTGAPSRGAGKRVLEQIAVYKRNPGEEAYNTIRGMTYDWLEREKGQEGRSAVHTPRSDALYEWKKAQRLGDKEAESKAFLKMRSLGMTPQDRFDAIKRAAPLGALSFIDRNKFKRTLTSRELKALEMADSWYKATFSPGAGRDE